MWYKRQTALKVRKYKLTAKIMLQYLIKYSCSIASFERGKQFDMNIGEFPSVFVCHKYLVCRFASSPIKQSDMNT